MCGIAGFSRHQFAHSSTDMLESMGQAIFHRGPDAGGTYIDDNVGLCHRRLSILDLSTAGNQPMYSQDQRYIIVFNGEIYNFLELRADLEAQGVSFTTHTDTEVILELYAKVGVKCLDKLNGMFAFALWDSQEKTLFLARDRIGKKPLYYVHNDQGQFAFGSEIKALLPLPFVDRTIRDDAVYDFFAYQYVPDPKTIFTSVQKCPPAHYMLYKDGELTITSYWDIDFSHVSSASEHTLTEQLRELTAQCTKRRMVADVPLGAFLSGGVDSSGVVAMMAQQSDTPVKTCSIGFDEERFNETEFAQAVADQYHTEHHEFTVHANVEDRLEQIVSYFDEPFADPSLVPTYFVSELARQEVTVAIAGDGGDEIFAGYEKYAIDAVENRMRNAVPNVIRKKLLPPLANLFAGSSLTLFRKAKSLCDSLATDPGMGFYLTNAQIDDRTWQTLAKPEFKKRLNHYHPSQITLDTYNKGNGPDHLSRILYTDLKTFLPGGILVKVDRMSMAHSLEVRAPLLDKEVIEFAANLPSALKFKDGEKKHILKETFKPLLPDDILYRKKMGFSVPLDSWFRQEIKSLSERYLFTQVIGLTKYFEASAIKGLWDQHQQGSHQHGAVLWSLLMFEMWYQKYAIEETRL
jgi:asparagine synthase (glutamine-hydrolysing)